MLIVWPLGTSITPPANCKVIEETPLTTVMERVIDVEVSKFEESVGEKSAVRETEPSEAGVHEHVAVVVVADAEPQPLIVTPPNLKFTAPARGTVAVMVIAPPSAAVEALLGSAIDIDVVALLTVIVNVLEPIKEFPSVARTV